MTQSQARNRRQRGITLVEALVAMAVMAIGLLGLVGVQSSLRTNSDTAKQRAQAVRLAQEGIEEWRAYVSMNAIAGQVDYTDIITTPAETFDPSTDPSVSGSNTTFTRVRTVTPMPAPLQGRAVTVRVSWVDRSGNTASVQLNTAITAAEPALTATLHIPAGKSNYQTPQGRNRGIPPSARTFPDNPRYSGFIPPGMTGVVWRFDNITGVITLCSSEETLENLTYANVNCSDQRALLVSGFVRFANSMSLQPTADEARAANGVIESGYDVRFNQTGPATLVNSGRLCASATVTTPERYLAYYCAVPTVQLPNSPAEGIDGNLWINGAPITAVSGEVAPTMRRVCRFFNPRAYDQLKVSLPNQNLLIIAAGDGTNPFTCEITEADRTTRLAWPHQPAS